MPKDQSLSSGRLRPDLPTPLYYQLYLILLDRIKTRHWRAGEYLESEILLARRYGISRATARQAVLRLADEGWVVRKRGKGTRVSKGGGSRTERAGLKR